MAKIIDINHKINKTKSVDEVVSSEQHDTASFHDEDINPAYVYDVIGDPKVRLAFVTMLLALRQISTDGEAEIRIDDNGILFNSPNSIETGEFLNGFQANMALNKQAYLFIADELGQDKLPQELADALGVLLESLILHTGTIDDDDL